MKKKTQKSSRLRKEEVGTTTTKADRLRRAAAPRPNPPRTTTGRWFTAPMFGSAGSGGAEFEPGPELA